MANTLSKYEYDPVGDLVLATGWFAVYHEDGQLYESPLVGWMRVRAFKVTTRIKPPEILGRLRLRNQIHGYESGKFGLSDAENRGNFLCYRGPHQTLADIARYHGLAMPDDDPAPLIDGGDDV
jgi:hypothetical protein